MAKTVAAPSAAVAAPTKFQLSKLRENSERLFGVSSSTFAGATAKLPDGEYTIEEIKATIQKWQNKEVK